MKNILVPVDGSASSMHALRYAAKRFRGSQGVCLLVLNVQPSVLPSELVPTEIIRAHHERMSENALAPARRICKRFGIAFRTNFTEGDPSESIVGFARRSRCGEIIMGTRGLGRVSGLVLGSVATKVVHLAKIPITLIK